MKIGDKVRFLNATGGGVIAHFNKGGIVIVTDDDGFDVPTLSTEIVVVGETTSLNIPKQTPEREYALKTEIMAEDFEVDPADLPITFRPRPIEREDGDTLSVFLAFVPIDAHDVLNCSIEVYLINDTNYYLNFAYIQQEDGVRSLLKHGELLPNTKLQISTKKRNELSHLGQLHIQGFAYKLDSNFVPLPTIDVAVRLDLKKFYKKSSFVSTLFFKRPALLHTIVKSDVDLLTTATDLETLTNNFPYEASPSDRSARSTLDQSKYQADGTLVIDLHATALLDSTHGLNPAELLAYQVEHFKKTMEAYKNKSGQKIIFIHGKGEGVLRKAIITELRRYYKRCHYQDASFAEYGFGATQVTIHC